MSALLITSQNWTVHKDYIEDSFEIVETTNTQSEDKIFPMKDVKTIKYKEISSSRICRR